MGCRGLRCSAPSSSTGRLSSSSRNPRRCWAWTRPGSGGPAGCPTAPMLTAGSGGGARIRGRPGSSTSLVIRPCWGRSTAGPAPRFRPGWPPAPQAFRAGIEVVVIDPHAGYAAAVRTALPDAVIAVDHFHLIMLANKTVTAVRQRVTRDLLGRRGRKIDPTWANRRLLLRGRERLSAAGLARMWNGCVDHDPTGQILSAWIAKEELRALCATAAAGGHRHEIRRAALGVLPVVRRRADPRADHARRDDRDVVAGDRGVPHDRADERPDRGHKPVDQAGETRRLRLPEPGELPSPGKVACHRWRSRNDESHRRAVMPHPAVGRGVVAALRARAERGDTDGACGRGDLAS